MKTKEIITGIIVLTAIIAGTIIYLNDNKEDFSKEESAVFKANFIEGCMLEGENYALCSCAYDYLAKDLGEKKFIQEAMKAELTDEYSDRLVESMADAIVECL